MKDGEIAENCGCCACDQCSDSCLLAIDILSPSALSGPLLCADSTGAMINTINHAPCTISATNRYSFGSVRTSGILQFASFDVARPCNVASVSYENLGIVVCRCSLLVYCTKQLSQDNPQRPEWYAITAWYLSIATAETIVVTKSSRRKLSSACVSKPYRGCPGLLVVQRQEFLNSQSDITITSASDGFGAWQNDFSTPNSSMCKEHLLDTFSATFRIVQRSSCNPLP